MEPDSTIFDGELDRRTILRTMGAAAAASSLAGCPTDDSSDDESGGGVLPGSVELNVSVDDARGSDANQTRQQLYFVEAGSGSLVRFDLRPKVSGTASSGTDTIDRTQTFDLDTGQKATNGTDLFWRFVTESDRQLEPQNGAELVALPDASYDDVSASTLPMLGYGTDPIPSDDLSGGIVIAVHTDEGNYAKVDVTPNGDSLDVEYETYDIQSQLQRIGTGYDAPDDVVLAPDGGTAYVTDAGTGGSLLEVTLSNADRSQATEIATDLGNLHQIALDPPSDVAYVTTDSRIVRIDLDGGDRVTIASGLTNAVGLVVDADGTTGYVGEQGAATNEGTISRVDLGEGHTEELASGLTAPYHLAWADDSEEEILFVERDPGNTLSRVDLAEDAVDTLVDGTSVDPASVSMTSLDEGIVCGESSLEHFDLTDAIYEAAGPLFTGIGHIPVSAIDQDTDVPQDQAGYANTGADFPFTVTDAPFGGTLQLMLDHYQARSAEGATHYRVEVDGTVRSRGWTALEWNGNNRRYESTEVSADGDGFFELRQNASNWFRPRLGYKLRTGDLTNGLHEITVSFHGSASASDTVAEKTVQVRIDNEPPTARLGRIFHLLSDDSEEVVDACAIVDTATDQFQFEVTASDPQDHLRHWRLVARWGNNQRDVVASQSYADEGTDGSWTGPKNVRFPDGGWWTASQTQCAHTFHLRAWGRAINGYTYVHRDGYHKSVTLMIPSSETSPDQ